MSSIHLELFDKKRLLVWKKLAGFKQAVLGGGTALSLQLAHRYSYDFDLFLLHEITPEDKNRIIGLLSPAKITLNTNYQLDFIAENGIKITLWHNYAHPIKPLVKTSSLPLLDYQDIAADKTYILGNRSAWRDYADLFFLLKNKITLEKLISLSSQKYGDSFNAKLLLQQLIYFKDIPLININWVSETYSDRTIKAFFLQQVKKYTEKHILSIDKQS